MPGPWLWLALPAGALVQFATKGVPFLEQFQQVRCCALPRTALPVHCSARAFAG